MIRLFIALIIPGEVKEKLSDICNEIADNSIYYKWESRDKIHLTLKFIGDVQEYLLPEITHEISVVIEYASFNCTISKFGFFFHNNEAKILWCNLDTDESIISLIGELNTRLSKFNIEIEKRKFKGHLTLLRIKNKVDIHFVKSFKEYKFIPIHFKADQIALIQSYLKQGGSEYKILNIYELKDRRL